MKYLEKAPMFFGYGKGQASKADPKTCPHPKQVLRGDKFVCIRCDKEMR